MEEKEVYQDTAKQTLKKLVDEKLEAVNKQKELEKALSNIEDEYASLKELHDKDVAQNRELAVQVRTFQPSHASSTEQKLFLLYVTGVASNGRIRGRDRQAEKRC